MESPKAQTAESSNHSSELITNHEQTDTAALLPHLESIEKMMKLPVLEAAWNSSQDVYGKVKSNLIFFRLFSFTFFFVFRHFHNDFRLDQVSR